MFKRMLCWALDIYSPSRALLGEPSRYSFWGAVRGKHDRMAPTECPEAVACEFQKNMVAGFMLYQKAMDETTKEVRS